MNNRFLAQSSVWSWAVVGLLAAMPSLAGVVYEIEVTDRDASQSPESVQTSVQDGQLKMQMHSKDNEGEMIFRGDRREMIMVDHDERAYTVIDQQTIAEIGAKMSEAERMMAEALKNVPPEQRPMMERMMKQRMPQQSAAPRAPITLEKTGETATHNGYPCVRYDVIRGGRAIRELWVTDWDNVEGAEEVVKVFQDMAEFMSGMLEALPQMGGRGPVVEENMFEYMNRLDGFPVVTRELSSGGEVTSESELRSVERQSLDPAVFEPPAGYKARSLMGR